MSPTPVTYVSPTQPATYSWEATDEQVAERYGVDPATIVRFDLNTSPEPPDLAAELLAAGRFEVPLSEYPPSDYRRLVVAAAETYGVATDELLVGAGADEVLDLIGKAFLSPDDVAVVPSPSYAMYRVITEQRGARLVAVPRQGPDRGWAMDVDAVRAAAAGASVVWLCSPNNPTALAEPDGSIERLLAAVVEDADAAGREPPVVALDEAYAEFVGTSLVPLRRGYPNLVVVRTASKAYALAGLRVGFAIARPETIERLAVYRPPGSVGTVSVTVVTEALRRPAVMEANVARVTAERSRLTAALQAAGWQVGPSVTNFVLATFSDPAATSAAAETLLQNGLVPRTFAADHPLAASLRLTVRNPAENDRLIAAATAASAAADDTGSGR
jgi:histidinol-phosphate aminotransferase